MMFIVEKKREKIRGEGKTIRKRGRGRREKREQRA